MHNKIKKLVKKLLRKLKYFVEKCCIIEFWWYNLDTKINAC